MDEKLMTLKIPVNFGATGCGDRGSISFDFGAYPKRIKRRFLQHDGQQEKPKRGHSTVTRCPHKDARHYAKGMCNNCYHSFGRTKMAFNCQHSDRAVYAKGLC